MGREALENATMLWNANNGVRKRLRLRRLAAADRRLPTGLVRRAFR